MPNPQANSSEEPNLIQSIHLKIKSLE